MSKQRQQIAQIKKYTSGQLDARAMHKLEREALDDPFLADALEGYQASATGQAHNLAELNDRLHLRIEPPVRRLIAWKPLAIAASILVLIGIGVWLMLPAKTGYDLRVADNIKPAEQDKRTIAPIPGTTDTAQLKPRSYASASQPGEPVLSSQVLAKKKTIANSQNLSQDANSSALTDTSLFVKKPSTTIQQVQSQSFANAALPKQTDKQAAPVTLNEVSIAQADVNANKKAAPQTIGTVNKTSRQETLLQSKVEGVNVTSANRTLTGTVTGLNGTPLAGAVVKMAGNNFGVITDENGRFVIHDVPEKKSLSVGYIGYSSAMVRVNGEDSVNVSLSPTSHLKSSSNAGSMDAQRSGDAHPSAGWKALQEYLSKNASMADGQGGKVYLSFTVDAQRNLSNFKILKSLSSSANQKAIDLLVHGPGWVGNADGKAHEVKLTVEFR